ncbi:MAG TPA: ribonuclease H-like domain-containing protein, partial [Chitinophagaceae bacterium]|nr:ribonuclease H-like domain-containing protein [Chitinophagaceae bacterium]
MEFSSLCDSFFTSPSKQFCGHNIREFDLPFLCRRMLIQNIPLPRILKDLQSKKPWENPVCDTLQWWKFGEYKQFTSLALLTEVLGIPSPKESMDGSEVADAYYLKNNLQGIVRYCRRDVEAVMQVWFRLNGMHHFTALRKADSIYEGSERTD